LKKKLDWPLDAKRGVSEPDHPRLSIARPCALVGFPRSSFDDAAEGESAENLQWRRFLDEPYTQTPFYGVRRMTVWLRQQGHVVTHQRVARLRHTRGLETIDPKPRLSQPPPERRVYSYLLPGVPSTRVHQVWSTDIPYRRLHAGFLDVVAVMDWFSRSVLSWAVSITMDVGWCLEAQEEARGVATPDIFHSDQGAQFTSVDFTGRLAAAGIRMSMDGRASARPHLGGASLAYGQI
jgi:putative transposase